MASGCNAGHFHSHQVLGNFSVDQDGVYKDDKRMRRIFVDPDDDIHGMNLLEGIDDHDPPARSTSGQGKPRSMTSLLEWMRHHRAELEEHDILQISDDRRERRLDVDFFGQRGVFCRLLRAIETVDRMEVLVTLCNGTYYMETFKDVEKVASKDTDYCSKNFKRHLTLVDGAQPGIDLSHVSYYSAVIKTQCEQHKLILSCGIDAERDNPDKSPPGNYIDIKTRYRTDSEQNKQNFKRYTTLKWWSQAVIAGIPEVICGWRHHENEKVIVSSTELMKTEHLPLQAPMMISGRRFWEADACLDTFQTLLDNIKDLITEDNPRIVHRLELPEVEKGMGLKERLQARRFNLLGRRQDDYVILPDWYLQEILWIEDPDSE